MRASTSPLLGYDSMVSLYWVDKDAAVMPKAMDSSMDLTSLSPTTNPELNASPAPTVNPR